MLVLSADAHSRLAVGFFQKSLIYRPAQRDISVRAKLRQVGGISGYRGRQGSIGGR